jgi:hypothetical protein
MSIHNNLRNNAAMSDPVDEARAALRQMRFERGARLSQAAAYRKQMSAIGADKTVLDFDDIDRAVAKAQQIKTSKGQSLLPRRPKDWMSAAAVTPDRGRAIPRRRSAHKRGNSPNGPRHTGGPLAGASRFALNLGRSGRI